LPFLYVHHDDVRILTDVANSFVRKKFKNDCIIIYIYIDSISYFVKSTSRAYKIGVGPFSRTSILPSMSREYNDPAPGVSFYTPHQNPPSGTAVDPQPNGQTIPMLFKPLKIRGVDFHNRIFVSIFFSHLPA